MAATCRRASTTSIFPPRTPPRTRTSRPRWRATSISRCRSPRRPRNNSTPWSSSASASSTSPASRSSPSLHGAPAHPRRSDIRRFEMNSTTTTTVPLISSGSAGPLGVLHLPRLWTKLTLGTAGKLAAGYDFCGAGFDQMTLNALNLDREKTIAYVEESRPTYLQFEEWIVEQNGGKIPQAAIDEHNKAVKGYNHGDDLAAQ